MKYIDFYGNRISKLSLGTVQFGLNYGVANTKGQLSQEDVNEIIDYVYANGVNCFDTAQVYGVSEQVLGHAIKDKEKSFVISKIKSNLFLDSVELNVDKSIDNLGVNTLFGLLLHDSKLLYKWNAKYSKSVEYLIHSKRIEYFGVSIYTNEDFELAIDNDLIKIIQIPFNVFDQRAIMEQWIEKAQKKNKLIFIRSVFLPHILRLCL